MSVFGSGRSGKGGEGMVETLIGRQTEVLGDIRFGGGLHVDGRVLGKVIAAADKGASLSISETGTVEGDVSVPNILLNGTVAGDVHSTEKLTLGAKARVTGNVFYKVIEMQGGAQVNGQLIHGVAEVRALMAPRPEPGESKNGGATVIDVRELRDNRLQRS